MSRSKRRLNPAAVLVGILALAAIGAALAAVSHAVVKHMQTPEVHLLDSDSEPAATTTALTTTELTTTTTTATTTLYPQHAQRTTNTVTVTDTDLIYARNFVLVSCGADGDTVIAERGMDEQIYPASLTKIMTMVTFRRLCPEADMRTQITMDGAAITSAREQWLHVAGFTAGETVTVRDLLYAMMLPSGADAALMLAQYAAGSEAAFVEQMNETARILGMTKTVYKNCTGVHDDAHVSSVSDIALLLRYALRDPVCCEIMSTRTAVTSATAEHPEGIELQSTVLWRMNGGELDGLPDPLIIRGGKTGFTNPAGQCLATWAESAAGNTFICVLTGSTAQKSMDAISDLLTIYQLSSKPLTEIGRYVLREEDILDPPPHF